jgi:hypothetical protein
MTAEATKTPVALYRKVPFARYELFGQQMSDHADERIDMRGQNTLYSAEPVVSSPTPTRLADARGGAVHEPRASTLPDHPEPAPWVPSVPIANEESFVEPDTLGTTIKLASLASRRYPLAWRQRTLASGQVL